MTTLSARRHYRKQVKSSNYRGKDRGHCRSTMGCKSTRAGKRKSYCRKIRHTRRHSRSHRAKTNRYELLSNSS